MDHLMMGVRQIRRQRPRIIPHWAYILPLIGLLALSIAGGRAYSEPIVDLNALEQAFQQVVDHVSPSVVGIRSRRRHLSPLPTSDSTVDTGMYEQQVVINGSGTIIREDGLILTNEHVVRGAWEVEVVLHDGRVCWAQIVASDTRSDLAILRIDAEGLQPAKICDWNTVSRGQWSIAIGNPFGLGADGQSCISVGVIANLGRRLPGLGEVDDRLYADMIQTTAVIHPGNSGGPLFNIREELIGVVTAVHARGADDEGIGFAIPMTPARWRIIEQLLEGQPISYGYLGVTVRSLEFSVSGTDDSESSLGVLLEKIEPAGPAAKAGLQVGDVIVSYEGHVIDAPIQLAELVGLTPVGKTAILKVYRGKKSFFIHIVVDQRQINRVNWMRGAAILWRGMRLANLTAESRKHMKVNPDAIGVVVIDVAAGSPAEHAHIEVGDVVDHVENKLVCEVATFLQQVRGQKDAIRLQIRNRGNVTISP